MYIHVHLHDIVLFSLDNLTMKGIGRVVESWWSNACCVPGHPCLCLTVENLHCRGKLKEKIEGVMYIRYMVHNVM